MSPNASSQIYISACLLCLIQKHGLPPPTPSLYVIHKYTSEWPGVLPYILQCMIHIAYGVWSWQCIWHIPVNCRWVNSVGSEVAAPKHFFLIVNIYLAPQSAYYFQQKGQNNTHNWLLSRDTVDSDVTKNWMLAGYSMSAEPSWPQI